MTYAVRLSGPFLRALERAPVKVADACLWRLKLLEHSPMRIGHALKPPFEGQHTTKASDGWRLRYEIDEGRRVVEVLALTPRSSSYMPSRAGRRR